MVFTFSFFGLRASLPDLCCPLAMLILLPGANAPLGSDHSRSATLLLDLSCSRRTGGS
jgi:hypothetical protein